MCGIVGYLGPQNPKDVIIDGLKTLEYRGYDSAGLAVLNEGVFKRVRAEGKLSALDKKIKTESFDGHVGIGHTRWATHGPPSERNAHPHCVEGVNLVHNGIIENYSEIRGLLTSKGVDLESDTDTELVAHLISHKLRKEKNFLKASASVVPELRGAYSILVVSKDHPNEMVAFKNGPPLVVGVGENESIISSDIQAIVPHTKRVIYLEDDHIVHIKDNQVQIFDKDLNPLDSEVVEVTWSAAKAEKAGFPHFMAKEIFEQPRAVAAAIDPHVDLESREVALKDVGFDAEEVLAETERVFIVACGTSYYAGMIGEYLIERFAKVPVEIDIASEFRYREPVIPKNSLVIVISQSGETADTLAALRLVKKQNAKVLAVCNVPHSSIDREADGHLFMNAGVEVGVASTKALTCSIAVLNLFALELAKVKGQVTKDEEKEIVESLIISPSQMEKVLAYDSFFEEASETLKNYKGFLYMGRGVSYPVAMEGALKLKELAYMHAEGYAAGEMKHGPLALIDNKMAVVMIAPSDGVFEKTLSNLEEAKARGGQIISIGTGDNEELKNLSVNYLSIPEGPWYTSCLFSLIPLQLLSYHVANRLNHDVDQPRNLAKSVTVE